MGIKRKYEGYINLRLLTGYNNILHFKVKKNKPILVALNDCFQKLSCLPPSLVKFIFDGYRITEGETPRSLMLEENDIIEVYEVQDGGYLV